MSKKLLAATVILVLAITVLTSMPVLRANFIPTSAEIRIDSPVRLNMKLYENTPIPIVVTVKEPENAPQYYHQVTNVYYCLDEQPAIEITNITMKIRQPWFSGTSTEYHAYAVLDNIESGSHTLLIYSVDDVGNHLSASIEFAYKTYDVPPQVTVFSPLNMTYSNTTELPLNFVADEFVVGTYSLDIRGSSRISENTTLTGLTNGMHILMVSVYTKIGVYSQTTYFLIDGNTESQGFDSKMLLIVIGSSVAAAIAGLLFYFRRRKRYL